MRGAFVAVEGPDGVGKTTLVGRLAGRLQEAGVDGVVVREPGGTPVAEAARKVAFAPELEASPLAELFLVLAARADLVAKVIRPALADGKLVLTDRYELSTFAYQVAGRQLPREEVVAANALATGGLRPHLTLVLDAPAAVGLGRQREQRKVRDRMEREESELHDRVSRFYAELSDPTIVHLDGTRSADLVAADAWSVLHARLRETFVCMQG